MAENDSAGFGLRQQALFEAEERARLYVDGRGRGLDEDIVSLVAVLNALEFPTLSSCAGHTDHGQAGPWVRIGHSRPEDPGLDSLYEEERQILIALSRDDSPERSGPSERPRLLARLNQILPVLKPYEDVLRQENAAIAERMQTYLDAFDATHPTHDEDRLLIDPIGRQGVFDVNAAQLPVASDYEQTPEGQAQLADDLEWRQAGMARFCEYLTELFIAGPETELAETHGLEPSETLSSGLQPVLDARPTLSSLDESSAPAAPRREPAIAGLEL